eukprot:TRINITY_DN2954_c0_g1_i3.p1 TRINITY_DN2954_c0_g1~~TRINITY_DN2954_c0_g1_i3.p1  ORF type:complete len:175 (-),score=16.68 TRINITY_DN2954_c0_g1_i3:202-726(-)
MSCHTVTTACRVTHFRYFGTSQSVFAARGFPEVHGTYGIEMYLDLPDQKTLDRERVVPVSGTMVATWLACTTSESIHCNGEDALIRDEQVYHNSIAAFDRLRASQHRESFRIQGTYNRAQELLSLKGEPKDGNPGGVTPCSYQVLLTRQGCECVGSATEIASGLLIVTFRGRAV